MLGPRSREPGADLARGWRKELAAAGRRQLG
jgi:hypothetical protein